MSLQNQINKKEKLNFSEVGRIHNEILEDFFYCNNTERTAELIQNERSVEEYFGEIEQQIVHEVGEFNDLKISEDLYKENLISSEVESYIQVVENILENPGDSIMEMDNSIKKLEKEAEDDLSGDDSYQFISYAETARASLEFWNENYIKLQGLELGSNARGAILDYWNQYKHKLGMMAASDAAGAAAGAAIGIVVGGSMGIPPDIAALAGATVCGSASSIKGFKEDKVCVVIPLEKIIKEMGE